VYRNGCWWQFQNLGYEHIETGVLVVPPKFVDAILCPKGFAVVLDVLLEGVISRGSP
jgi:hypothetical protein